MLLYVVTVGELLAVHFTEPGIVARAQKVEGPVGAITSKRVTVNGTEVIDRGRSGEHRK